MRAWMVDPSILCKSHLLGEHRETHTMLGALKKGIRLSVYLDGLYDPPQLWTRHEDLVREMNRRGYKHLSPLETINSSLPRGRVDILANYIELVKRCPECAKNIAKKNLAEEI